MTLPADFLEKTSSPEALRHEVRQTCWPNELEVLLLRAGLCEVPQALVAWNDFCGQVDIENLSEGCYRLLPLVAGNLQNCGQSLQHRDRIFGVLRHAWAKNQRLFGNLTPLLQTLQKSGVEILLLKGAALDTFYRQQGSVRAMADIDILIHPQDLIKTVEILQGLNCTSNTPITPDRLFQLIHFRHELTLKSATGMDLDIHWYLVADARHMEAEDYFWRDAVPCSLGALSARTLHPTDQLLHTCLHGSQWNEISPVRWLADAVMLIRQGIDWNRLEEQARRLERLSPIRETLLFLDHLEIHLPPGVIDHWSKVQITNFEKVEGSYRTRRPNSRERTKQLAWTYLRLNRNRSFGELLYRMPAYMRQVHHFRAYSRCMTFLIYFFLLFLDKNARSPSAV